MAPAAYCKCKDYDPSSCKKNLFLWNTAFFVVYWQREKVLLLLEQQMKVMGSMWLILKNIFFFWFRSMQTEAWGFAGP